MTTGPPPRPPKFTVTAFISLGVPSSWASSVLGQGHHHLPDLREQRLLHFAQNLEPAEPGGLGTVFREISGRVVDRDVVDLHPAAVQLAEAAAPLPDGPAAAAY